MKTRKLMLGLAVALLAMGVQSCGGQTRPENNDGHNLWLGDITVKSGPADVAVWKIESKRIDLNALGVKDIGFDASGIYNNSLGDEGFSINCIGNHVAVTANTDAAKLYAVFYLK